MPDLVTPMTSGGLRGKDEATEPGIKRRWADVVPVVGVTPPPAAHKFAQCYNPNFIARA